jgi:hypothetical protein
MVGLERRTRDRPSDAGTAGGASPYRCHAKREISLHEYYVVRLGDVLDRG